MVGDVGIGLAFLAEGGEGAVAGDEGGILAQGPELFTDGADQGVVIAPWQVGAADGALKQHITDDGQLILGAVKDDVVRRVAGAVDDL